MVLKVNQEALESLEYLFFIFLPFTGKRVHVNSVQFVSKKEKKGLGLCSLSLLSKGHASSLLQKKKNREKRKKRKRKSTSIHTPSKRGRLEY
jgi:hypothetical protein